LQQGQVQRLALEQEIGSFGTGLSNNQEVAVDDAYDNTFMNDPGHISRAEILFNRALK